MPPKSNDSQDIRSVVKMSEERGYSEFAMFNTDEDADWQWVEVVSNHFLYRVKLTVFTWSSICHQNKLNSMSKRWVRTQWVILTDPKLIRLLKKTLLMDIKETINDVLTKTEKNQKQTYWNWSYFNQYFVIGQTFWIPFTVL